MLVYSFTSIGVVVVAMATLSYLGCRCPAGRPGVGPVDLAGLPVPVGAGKSFLWIFPSAAIAITTLGFAFVADGLRDALDPKLRGRN
ncbi:hypothetical protein [Pseudonocardia sp. ICBG601]|uniref:hypothetical protein n=1 Tax=Pseudonocardia sp. ICBG601 TaxID=2846759 RepID=UPI001CF63B78|nr:hypothetical protein [Pseudonocardia sp. ICBG601]